MQSLSSSIFWKGFRIPDPGFPSRGCTKWSRKITPQWVPDMFFIRLGLISSAWCHKRSQCLYIHLDHTSRLPLFQARLFCGPLCYCFQLIEQTDDHDQIALAITVQYLSSITHQHFLVSVKIFQQAVCPKSTDI